VIACDVHIQEIKSHFLDYLDNPDLLRIPPSVLPLVIDYNRQFTHHDDFLRFLTRCVDTWGGRAAPLFAQVDAAQLTSAELSGLRRQCGDSWPDFAAHFAMGIVGAIDRLHELRFLRQELDVVKSHRRPVRLRHSRDRWDGILAFLLRNEKTRALVEIATSCEVPGINLLGGGEDFGELHIPNGEFVVLRPTKMSLNLTEIAVRFTGARGVAFDAWPELTWFVEASSDNINWRTKKCVDKLEREAFTVVKDLAAMGECTWVRIRAETDFFYFSNAELFGLIDMPDGPE
jgi:hypothetical protein